MLSSGSQVGSCWVCNELASTAAKWDVIVFRIFDARQNGALSKALCPLLLSAVWNILKGR